MQTSKRSLTEDYVGEEGPSCSKQRCFNPPSPGMTFQYPLRKLFDNLNKLRINKTLCDWTIRTNDNQDISAHTIVLELSSTYFKKMHLESLKKGTRMSTIDLPSCLLNVILDFWYTGQCKINEENVLQLLKAALDHDFNDITHECHRFIMKELRPENCISKYHQTKSFLPEDLSDEIFRYILRNFIRVLHHMKHPFELDVEEMVEILSTDDLNVGDERVLFRLVTNWIDEDLTNREQHTRRLLNCLRLGRNEDDGRRIEGCDIVGRLCKNNNQRFTNDVLFVFGRKSPEGIGKLSRQPCVQVFDKCAEQWFDDDAPDLRQIRFGLGVLSNVVYIVGGFVKRCGFLEYRTATNKVNCFDPEKKLWWESACMFDARSDLCVVACNGLLYAIGGLLCDDTLNSAERYDPGTNQWSRIASMNESRNSAGSVELHGKIYVAGGLSDDDDILDSVEVYSPDTDQWTFIEPMRIPRYGLCCVAYQNTVYAIGGAVEIDQPISIVERYVAMDKEPKWEFFNTMCLTRMNFTAVIMDDAIFAIGGLTYSGRFELTITMEKLSFAKEDSINGWELQDATMEHRIIDHTACVISGLKNAKEYSYQEYVTRKIK